MIVAFGTSWAIWAPLVLDSSHAREVAWLLYYSGVIGPTVAALLCASYSSDPGSLFRRVGRWRVSLIWYAVAMLLPFAIRGAAVATVLLYDDHGWRVVFRPAEVVMRTTGLMLLLVPLEEIGWRGYALPILQRRYTPLISSVILGSIWALWHFPLAWATVGYQRTENPWSYMAWFFITIIPVSCLATWVFNRTGESIPLVSLFHVTINMADFIMVLPARTGQVVLLITFVLTTAIVGVIVCADKLGTRRRGT